MQYRLADDVFFRRYGENTIVYKTGKSIVLGMNAVCFDVLSFFQKKENPLDACSDYLHEKYKIEDFEAAKQGLSEFYEELIAKEILMPAQTLRSKMGNLEAALSHGSLLPKGTLKQVMFELTYRCNEKCRHCYCVVDAEKKELTGEEMKGILDELRALNVLELTFTGGDLFVRSDTFEILEYAYEKNFLINIFTNGIALREDDFYRLQRIHPKSISFSIYNSSAQKHDAFTQIPGSFEKTVAAARKCRALGIPVNIKSCMVRENADDVDNLLKLIASLDATAQIGCSISPKNDGGQAPAALRIDDEELYLKTMRKLAAGISEDGSESFEELIEKDRKLCWSGESGISIDPYGEVYPCNALHLSCGNVRTQSVKEIWENSETLKTVRGYTVSDLQGCGDCEDRETCAFCMGNAMNESGNPLQKYAEACHITKAQSALRKEMKENVCHA